jgi:hypothetical protein
MTNSSLMTGLAGFAATLVFTWSAITSAGWKRITGHDCWGTATSINGTGFHDWGVKGVESTTVGSTSVLCPLPDRDDFKKELFTAVNVHGNDGDNGRTLLLSLCAAPLAVAGGTCSSRSTGPASFVGDFAASWQGSDLDFLDTAGDAAVYVSLLIPGDVGNEDSYVRGIYIATP